MVAQDGVGGGKYWCLSWTSNRRPCAGSAKGGCRSAGLGRDNFTGQQVCGGLRAVWVPAFRKIRQLRPQAEIAGPGFFSANLSDLRTFLTKAKADNVVPDMAGRHTAHLMASVVGRLHARGVTGFAGWLE